MRKAVSKLIKSIDSALGVSSLVKFVESKLELIDQVLGLRSWGLVLYGALPSSLSLLGILDIKLGSTDKLLPIVLVSLLPLLLTFMLIRARQRDWYFTTDYLLPRSLITTFLIVASATLIAGASGIIRDKYVFSLRNLTDHAHVVAMGESFLYGMASLVVSSTLFAAILAKDVSLPGLPASDFVKSAAGVRQKLIEIQRSSIWKNYDPATGVTIFVQLGSSAETVLTELRQTRSHPAHWLAVRALEPIEPDLNGFREVIDWIKAIEDDADTRFFRWQVFFYEPAQPGEQISEAVMRERNAETRGALYAAARRLKDLRLGGYRG